MLDDGTCPTGAGRSTSTTRQPDPAQRADRGRHPASATCRTPQRAPDGRGADRQRPPRDPSRRLPMPRMTNTYMLGGDNPAEEIVAGEARPTPPTSAAARSTSPAASSCSRRPRPYLIENGKIQYPVKGATLIGNGRRADAREHDRQRPEARHRRRRLRQGRPERAGGRRPADATGTRDGYPGIARCTGGRMGGRAPARRLCLAAAGCPRCLPIGSPGDALEAGRRSPGSGRRASCAQPERVRAAAPASIQRRSRSTQMPAAHRRGSRMRAPSPSDRTCTSAWAYAPDTAIRSASPGPRAGPRRAAAAPGAPRCSVSRPRTFRSPDHRCAQADRQRRASGWTWPPAVWRTSSELGREDAPAPRSTLALPFTSGWRLGSLARS